MRPLRSSAREILRLPNTSLSGLLCHPSSPSTLGLIRATGEALVVHGTSSVPAVPISQRGLPGLLTPFPPDFFFLSMVPFSGGRQGIARPAMTPEQRDYADNLCVVLPILTWDVLGPDGLVQETRRGGTEDCVSFKTRVPAVLVELAWDSADDFDLRVEEPGGGVLNFANRRTRYGKLLRDGTRAVCGSGRFGRESVVYPWATRESIGGEYRVRVVHFTSCGRASRWRLRVVVGDDLVREVEGESATGGNVVAEVTFFVGEIEEEAEESEEPSLEPSMEPFGGLESRWFWEG